jgi:broad specificity phosphatase PhoE
LQASLTGQYLASTGVEFDAAYAGSLKRQQHTAQLALASQSAAIEVLEDARLNEVKNDEHLEFILPRLLSERPDLQALVDQGLDSSKRFQKVIEAVFNYWVSPDCDEPAIQSWADYSGGVRAALAEIVDTQGAGRNSAVFTSGGTIATIVAGVLGMPGSGTYQFYEPIFNCSVTQLFYNRDRVSLSCFNDCSFLRQVAAERGEALVTYR